MRQQYIPEHFSEDDVRKYLKPKKRFHVFPIILLVLFTVMMYLTTLVWDYTWDRLEEYEAGNIKYAEEAFMEKYRMNCFEDIFAEKAVAADEFNGVDDYKEYMLDVYGSDYTDAQFVKGKTHDDGSVTYDIYLGNVHFAEYTVIPEGNGWIYESEDMNDELFVKSVSVKICVPKGASVYANDTLLDKKYMTSEKYEIHDYDDHDDKTLIPQFEIYDTGDIFILEPEIKVCGTDGREMFLEEKDGMYYALPVLSEEALEEIKTISEKAAITYAMYITQDINFEAVEKYLVKESEFYRRIKNFYHDWYRDHTVTYDNVEFSDVVMYNDDMIKLHISFDYHVNIGYKINDYDVEYTMCMVRIDGEWKIASMVM